MSSISSHTTPANVWMSEAEILEAQRPKLYINDIQHDLEDPNYGPLRTTSAYYSSRQAPIELYVAVNRSTWTFALHKQGENTWRTYEARTTGSLPPWVAMFVCNRVPDPRAQYFIVTCIPQYLVEEALPLIGRVVAVDDSETYVKAVLEVLVKAWILQPSEVDDVLTRVENCDIGFEPEEWTEW
ncbi:unnamed protein product [Fusarium equiseti]|uniref:Uncharacterized protein n=1 Tax=Fusarium equiseti TaxID=61235 RepID=A0A8J2N952_FUSEQ|nr:unnamed protein product [Fusarium equiseti]